jgi:hypothetical protein
VTEDQQTETPQPMQEWVKPEVRRLEAGSAEGGGDTRSDGVTLS